MALRICNFNVLAPSARICKPLNKIPWKERHQAICDAILQMAPDIACLQEFDFCSQTTGFAELYLTALASTFDLHTKQRTGGKQEGLAILVRREAFENVQVRSVNIEPYFCDRVGMFAKLRHRASGRDIVVANTHLTVAHASNNHDIPMARPLQMEQMLMLLDAETRGGASMAFLCGDMNSDHLITEPSGRYSAAEVSRPISLAFEKGLASALHILHPDAHPISHTCSYAHDGCVDYVFFRPSAEITLNQAFLYPDRLGLDVVWSPLKGWDHGADRILESTLSDHRPLVVDFSVAPVLQPTEEGES